MRRMVARAARARRFRARQHRLMVRAARAHRRASKRRSHAARARAHRHIKHGVMSRDFAGGLTFASSALGQSAASLAAASAGPVVARPATGGFAAGSTGTRLNPVLGGAANRLNAIAARVATAATAGARTSRRAGDHRKNGHHGSGTHLPGGGFSFPPIPGPGEIEHFVSVIPEAIWIALASALAFAGVGGAAAVRSGRRARRSAGEYAAVAAVALRDPLTGVLNRRGFIDELERELARARRYQTPFVLGYVDIRGLKAVNDSEGHLAGDDVIKQVAWLLTDSVRTEDAVGRLGGDELALLLTGQSGNGAEAVVQRIQAQLPACREAMAIGTDWDVTIGTASYPADGDTFEQLVSTADRRLYEQRGIQLR
jgi:diguanylate cyclase (GGDEF)-like protein